jgi:hypothetical protein
MQVDTAVLREEDTAAGLVVELGIFSPAVLLAEARTNQRVRAQLSSYPS